MTVVYLDSGDGSGDLVVTLPSSQERVRLFLAGRRRRSLLTPVSVWRSRRATGRTAGCR